MLSDREIGCLIKNKSGLSGTSHVVWLKNGSQNILLFGELHDGKYCQDSEQELHDVCSETKKPKDILSTLLKWNSKIKTIVEAPWIPADEPEHLSPLSTILYKGKDVILGDIRDFVFPATSVITKWYRLGQDHTGLRKLMIDTLDAVCFQPYIQMESSLQLYIRTRRNAYTFDEQTQDNYRDCFDELFELALDMHFKIEACLQSQAAFDACTETPAFLEECFTAYQHIGQKLSDLLSVIPVILATNTDCMFLGGKKHVTYIRDILTTKFGFDQKWERIGLSENNCILPTD